MSLLVVGGGVVVVGGGVVVSPAGQVDCFTFHTHSVVSQSHCPWAVGQLPVAGGGVVVVGGGVVVTGQSGSFTFHTHSMLMGLPVQESTPSRPPHEMDAPAGEPTGVLTSVSIPQPSPLLPSLRRKLTSPLPVPIWHCGNVSHTVALFSNAPTKVPGNGSQTPSGFTQEWLRQSFLMQVSLLERSIVKHTFQAQVSPQPSSYFSIIQLMQSFCKAQVLIGPPWASPAIRAAVSSTTIVFSIIIVVIDETRSFHQAVKKGRVCMLEYRRATALTGLEVSGANWDVLVAGVGG